MDMVPDWSSQTQQFQVKKGHNWMVPQKEMQVDHQNLIKSEKVSDIRNCPPLSCVKNHSEGKYHKNLSPTTRHVGRILNIHLRQRLKCFESSSCYVQNISFWTFAKTLDCWFESGRPYPCPWFTKRTWERCGCPS